MLIGLTCAVPRVTPTFCWKSIDFCGMPQRPPSLPGMPMSSAAWMTFWGPFGIESTMSTNAVLMEFSVAWIIDTAEP